MILEFNSDPAELKNVRQKVEDFCKKNQIKSPLFMPTLSPYEKEIILQTNCRKSAVELIKIVHDLWYDEAIELVIFRNSMLDKM